MLPDRRPVTGRARARLRSATRRTRGGPRRHRDVRRSRRRSARATSASRPGARVSRNTRWSSAARSEALTGWCQRCSSAPESRSVRSTSRRIASGGRTAARGGFGSGFSAGQIRCRQWTSSMASRQATRWSRSSGSRAPAPTAPAARTASASNAVRLTSRDIRCRPVPMPTPSRLPRAAREARGRATRGSGKPRDPARSAGKAAGAIARVEKPQGNNVNFTPHGVSPTMPGGPGNPVTRSPRLPPLGTTRGTARDRDDGHMTPAGAGPTLGV